MLSLLASSEAKAVWSPPTTLSEFAYPTDSDAGGNPLTDYDPEIAAHDDGSVTIVWCRTDGAVYYRHARDGAPTSGQIRLMTLTNETSRHIAVAPVGGNKTLVIFVKRTIGNYVLKAVVIGANGSLTRFDIGMVNDVRGSENMSDPKAASNGDQTATVAWDFATVDGLGIKTRRIGASGTAGSTYRTGVAGHTGPIAEMSLEGHGDGSTSLMWIRRHWNADAHQWQSGVLRSLVGITGRPGRIAIVKEDHGYPQISGAVQTAHADGSATIVWSEVGGWGYYWWTYAAIVESGSQVSNPFSVSIGVNGQYAGFTSQMDVASNDHNSATFAYGSGPHDSARMFLIAPKRDATGSNLRDQGKLMLDVAALGAIDADYYEPLSVVRRGGGSSAVIWKHGSEMLSVDVNEFGAGATETIIGEALSNVSRVATAPVGDTGLSLAWLNRLPMPEWGNGSDGSPRRAIAVTHAYSGESNASSTCPKLKVFGVAGSGENGGNGTGRPEVAGFGGPVGKYADALDDATGGRSVARAVVDYPAAPVGWDHLINTAGAAFHWEWGKYVQSVRSGVARLEAMLKEEGKRDDSCATITKLVLAGYSQGAHVIGDVIEQNRIPANVKARLADVVFFGDPRFKDRATNVMAKSSFESTRVGGLKPRRNGSFAPLNGSTDVHSYCRRSDLVCQGIHIGADSHGEYSKVESHWAAWVTASELDDGATNVSWEPFVRVRLQDSWLGRGVRLSCKVKAYGTCHTRLRYTCTYSGSRSGSGVVDYVGRADARGDLTSGQLMTTNCGFGAVSIFGDVRAVGAARGFVEREREFHVVLK